MNSNDEEQIFEAILDYLRRTRGFDFSGYKRSSLKRRVKKHIHSRQIDTFSDYLDYLEVHPEEFVPLFNTILINVTDFFRDTAAWEYLKNEIIPRIISQKSGEDPIRVWSAGCASGQEAYSLAILLAEALGVEQFRQRVKIYATDVDQEALTQARHASYSAREVESLDPELRQQYFEVFPDRYVFRSDLRRTVIFGCHDLMQDAPISRLDLLVCRNTLMYFNAETQGRILARFHFALNHTGALFVGKAEMLLTHGNLFSPISLEYRIFNKVARISLREQLLVINQTGAQDTSNPLVDKMRFHEAAFNCVPVAQLIVNLNGTLVLANQLALSMFDLSLQDLNRPLQDLEVSYRPLELLSPIQKAYRDRTSLVINDVVRHRSEGETQYLDVQITPLSVDGNDLIGATIIFIDVSRYHELQTEIQRSNQELETANEELQSSNEELETTNEELQSTNEELETTNEELQSTNEELETINEELQSTNEELQTINDELRQRTNELNQVNAFYNSILASLRAGVIVLDRQYNIISWNHETENLWGLRSEEVQNQSFFSLEIGLPVDQLREMIRNCLGGDDLQEITLNTINRLGRTMMCRITCNPLIGFDGERQGVILLMEEVN